MKRQQPIILKISQPCSENWEKMTPTDRGRFCLNCQKTVTDFSTMNDQELLSFLNNAQGNICGRFHTEQLNREISIPHSTRRQPIISVAAMVAVLTLIIPSVQAQSKTAQVQLVPDRSNTPQQSDTLIRITGIVRDSTDNTVLAGAFVGIKDQGIFTYTDSSGKFEFQIAGSLTGKTVTVHIQHIGFMTQQITVPLTCNMNNAEIQMQRVDMVEVVAGGVQTVVVSGRATLWQRFKYKVRHLFP